ncbi:toprim domain-containing protein [Bacillus sp. ILBB4]|nr:toprim domain-containing protein [Bacillus sp. ILBB4]
MPKYPDDFKEYIKQTAQTHEVINSIIGGVTSSGINFVAKCPFHEDSRPSLMINVSTNTWSCNGCGAGSSNHSKATSSDVYGFVMGYYNYNFGEAIEWLAKFLNVPLPILDQKQQFKLSQQQWWSNKCATAQSRFRENLMNNKEAYKYLRNRGLEDLDIYVWGLGFGDGEDQDFMNTKGKITFPIHDWSGNIASFTGRVPFGASVLTELNEKQKAEGKRITPKYDHRWPLNAKFVSEEYIRNHPFPEFDRNQYVYGLYQAKSYITQWKSATLVEGFTDVIQLHKRGLTNAVATLGTNLSEQHVLQLKRAGAKRVLLMRDGDDAGLIAMEKDSRILLQHGIEVQVCPLPDGHDPDSLARTFPLLDDAFSKYINKRTRTLTQWRVEKVYKEEQDEILFHYSRIGEIQGNRLEKVISLLASEDDPVQLDILLRQYAELFVVSYDSLKQKVHHFKGSIQHAQ